MRPPLLALKRAVDSRSSNGTDCARRAALTDDALASKTLPSWGTAAVRSLASESLASGSSVFTALKVASGRHVL